MHISTKSRARHTTRRRLLGHSRSRERRVREGRVLSASLRLSTPSRQWDMRVRRDETKLLGAVTAVGIGKTVFLAGTLWDGLGVLY